MKAKSFLLYMTWLCHCAWMADTMSSATFSTTTVHLSDTDSVIVNSDVSSSSLHSPISELISSYSILGTNPVDVQTSFSSASDHFSADMSTHAVETTATNTPSLASVTLILANFVTSSSNSSYIFDTDIVSFNSNIDTGIITSSRNSDFILNTNSVTSSSDFIFNTGTMTSTSSSNSDFVQNIVTASSKSDFIQNIVTASSKSDFIFNTVTSSKNSDFILDTVTSSQNSDFVPNSVTSSENSDLVLNTVTSSEKSDFVHSTVTPSESSDFILDTNTISSSSGGSIFTTITSNEASATNFNIFTTKSEVTNFYQHSDFKSEDILESNDILKTELTSSSDMESFVEKKTEFVFTIVSKTFSPTTSEVVTTASDSVSSSVSVLNILPTATSDAVSVSDTRSYLDTNSQANVIYNNLTDDLSESLQDTSVHSLYGQSSFVPSFLSVSSSLNTESIFSTTISPSFYDVSTESRLISSPATTAMSSQFSTNYTQSVESALKSESITYSDYNQTVIQTDSLTTVLSSVMLSSAEMEITESMEAPTIPSQSTYQMTTGIVDSLVSSMSDQPSVPISTSTSTYFSTYENSNQASAQSSVMHSLDVVSTEEMYSASEVLNTTRSQLSQSTEYVISSSQSDGGYTSYLISSDQLPVVPTHVSMTTQMQQESVTAGNSSPIEETSVIHTSSTGPEEYTSYRINNSLRTDVTFPYVSSTISSIDSSSEAIEMYGNYTVSSMNFYASTPRSSTLYQQGQQTNQQSSTRPTQQISFLFTDLVSGSLSTVMSTENITPSTSIEESMLQSSQSVQLETSSVSYTDMSPAGLSNMSSEVVLTQNSNQESNILTSSTKSSIFVSGSEDISKVTSPISYSTNLPSSTAIYQATTEMIELTDTSLSSIFTNQQAVSTSSTYSFSRDFTSYPIVTYPSRSTSYIGMESSYSDVISGSMTQTVPLYFTTAPSATIIHLSSPTESSSVYQNESATNSNLHSLPHTLTFPSKSENNTISITTTTMQSGAPIFTSDILESYSESSSAVNQILLTSSSDSLQSATDLESSSESLLSFYYDLLTTTMFSDLLTSSSKLSSPDLILDTRSDSNSVSTSSSMSVIPTVESSTHLIQLFPSTQHLPSQTSSFYPASLFSVTDRSETSTMYMLSHLNESVYQTVPSSTVELVLPTPSVSLPKQLSGTSILPGFLDSTIEGIESPIVSTSVLFSTSLSGVASEITTADGHKASVSSSDESNILVMTSESVLEQSLSKSSLLTVPTYILGSELPFISSSTPTYRDSGISVLESTTMTQTVDLSIYHTTDLSTVKASSASIYVESSASSLSIVEVSTEPVTGSSTGSTSIVSTPGEIFESTIKASVVPSTLEVESVSDSLIVTQSSVVVSTVESVTFVAPSVEISVESTTASSVVSPTSVLVSDESTSDSVHLPSLSVVVSSSGSSMLASSSVEPSKTGMVSSPELHTTGESNLPTISIVSSPILPVDSTLSYTSTPLPLETTSVSLTQTNTIVPSFSVVSSVVDLVSPTLESSPETAMESNKETSSSLTDVVSMLPSDTPLLTTSVIQPSPEFVSSSSLTTITGSPLEQSSIDLTSDFIQSSSISPVESTVALNSSTLEPPTSTDGLNTSSALEDFWIKTVLKIRKSVDIETPEFKDNLEVKLVEAYSEAYKRQEEIDNGVYEPLLRRKRMASSSDINLQILNITRVENTNNVDVVYILQQNGVYVPAATATDKLNLFSDQELALRLGYVVDKNAVPYNEPIVGPTSTEDKKLWIIGAVLGPIAALLFIWFILCCVYRCCKRPAQEENKHKASEPHLVMVKRADRNGERQHLDIQVIHNHHEPDYVEEPVEKGTGPSILQSTKRGLYEVNQHQDEEEAPLQQKLPSPKQKTPVKRGNLTKEDIQMVSEGDTVTYISEGDLTASRPPKPKTRKSKTKKIEENLYGEDSMTEQELMDDRPYHTHPPSHDLNDKELMQKAALERKRNKQRLREKRKTEGPGSVGLTHNSDIENVLDSSHDKPLPDIFIHKPRKRPSKPKRNKPHSHMNERFSDDENSEVPKAPETIQEARKRMHQLLDDAFSLLSSSTSSIGSHSSKSSRSRIPRNKVNPAPPEEDKNYKPHTKPRSKKSNSTEKLTEEKSESPVYANPTFNGHDEGPVIETWSPYRAGDEVARISLPQTQAIKDKSPRQDKVNTTTFSEDLQTSLRDNYYTTEPAKPIVIKTKDLDRNGTKMNGISHLSSPMPNGGLSYPGIQNFDTLPSTRLNMFDNLNDDNIEMVTLTSNGHANQFEHRPYQAWRGDDEMDVIKKSIQPGVSPSPLIESIRDELKMLSRRNEANRHENIHIANGGDVSV